MKTNPLGNTGLIVSRLSFGASSLGGVFGPVDEAVGIQAVHTALDLGINYFDVAPAYGGTVAETVLGKALKGIPRDRYYLSTKAGKYTPPGGYGQDTLDFSRERSGVPISKLALQFSSQHPGFPTTLFSSARPESVRRNVQWHEEPFDPALLAAVQQVLSPISGKQWDYDQGVEEISKESRG